MHLPRILDQEYLKADVNKKSGNAKESYCIYEEDSKSPRKCCIPRMLRYRLRCLIKPIFILLCTVLLVFALFLLLSIVRAFILRQQRGISLGGTVIAFALFLRLVISNHFRVWWYAPESCFHMFPLIDIAIVGGFVVVSAQVYNVWTLRRCYYGFICCLHIITGFVSATAFWIVLLLTVPSALKLIIPKFHKLFTEFRSAYEREAHRLLMDDEPLVTQTV